MVATSSPKCPSRKLTSRLEVTQPEWSLTSRLSNQVWNRRFFMQTISRASNDGGFRRRLLTVKIGIMMMIGPILRLARDPQQWNAINFIGAKVGQVTMAVFTPRTPVRIKGPSGVLIPSLALPVSPSFFLLSFLSSRLDPSILSSFEVSSASSAVVAKY